MNEMTQPWQIEIISLFFPAEAQYKFWSNVCEQPFLFGHTEKKEEKEEEKWVEDQEENWRPGWNNHSENIQKGFVSPHWTRI